MAKYVSQDMVVPKGTILTFAENPDHEIMAALLVGDFEGLVGQVPYEPSIINYGEIHLGTPVLGNGTLFQFTSALFWDHGRFENYGLISAVVPAAFNTRALFAPSWGPDLFNAGRIEAESRFQAIAYDSWDATLVVTNDDAGTISVRSSEAPMALHMANGGTVINRGDILAHAVAGGRDFLADWAHGIALGPGGSSIFGATIVNSGLIEATDENAATARSVAIFYLGDGTGTLVNSGTIRGDYAIREQAEFSFYPNRYGFIVENSGLIEGRVFLDAGSDRIENRGHIVGEVGLGRGNDLWFSLNGTIQGAVLGGDGSDMLFGSAAADTLAGDAGDDVIQGGGGADMLGGGAGRDIFVYTGIGDSTDAGFDTLTDFTSGADRVDLSALGVQSVSIEAGAGFTLLRAVTAAGTLALHVNGALALSDLILSGSPAIGGTGGADMLHATAAGSILSGGEGDDVLVGAGGNDRLDGGGGDDQFWGGEGDDVYVVDSRDDIAWELAGQGYDRIELPQMLFGYAMPDNIEALSAAHSAGVTGNALGNVITGSAEGLQAQGAGGDDTLIGGASTDRLQGDAGSDRLFGQSGADTFVFTQLTDSVGYAMRSDGAKHKPDLIVDFTSGIDKIDLSAIDPIPGTEVDDAFIFIGTNAFTHRVGELRYEINDGTAQIYVDANGDGYADLQIAVVTPSLQQNDFIL